MRGKIGPAAHNFCDQPGGEGERGDAECEADVSFVAKSRGVQHEGEKSLIGGGMLFDQRRNEVGADIDPLLKRGVPNFGPIQDSRFYFNYHHTAADTLDKIVPRELAENAAINAVLAYALANLERPLPR